MLEPLCAGSRLFRIFLEEGFAADGRIGPSRVDFELDRRELLGLDESSAAAVATGQADAEEEGAAAAARKIAELGKQNGEDYLDKVARVHALLSPHAGKIVAYSNHEVDTATATATAAAAAADDGTAKSEAEAETGEKKKNNMYAAKVEMRLAIERRDVLKEFLRLEKEELGMDGDDHEGDGDEEDKDDRKPSSTNGGDTTATTTNRKGKRRRAG